MEGQEEGRKEEGRKAFLFKRQVTNRERRLASHPSDESRVSETYKELSQFNNKTNNQLKNGQKIQKDILPKKDMHVANLHMKRFSALVVIKEMQTNTLWKYLTPRMTIIKDWPYQVI